MKKTFKYFALFGVLTTFYFLFFSPPAPAPQIYDCFLFYNELELLEVRLHEMNPYVDHFVIVEACETFRGNPKPYYFEENRYRFDQFKDKIIHVKLEEPLATQNPWIRERYQRAQVARGLTECRDGDLIILSDVDEIVRGSLIPKISDLITSKKAQAVVCEQNMYQGFFNRFQDKWRGPVCVPYHVMKRISTKNTRRLRNMKPRLMRRTGIKKIECLSNAGWHFTSMGGPERHILKLESYSHAEFDQPELKKVEKILQVFRENQFVEVDETFPQFIVENKSLFEERGFIDQLPPV